MLQKNIIRKVIPLFFCLYPWAPIFIRKVNMWQAQGFFVYVGVLTLFCLSFFEKPVRVGVKNFPLSLLVLWVGLTTVWFNYNSIQNGGLSITIFSFFNFLTLILLYRILVQHLDKELIYKTLNWVSWSVIAMLLFCTLEVFGLAQFVKPLEGVNHVTKSKTFITGYVGNPTHLSAYIGMCLPLFFNWKRVNVLAILLASIILVGYTGMNYSVSLSGIAVAVIVSLYYLFQVNRKVFWWVSGVGVTAGIVTLIFINPSVKKDFFSAGDRVKVWLRYFDISKSTFITGRGLGSVRMLATDTFKHLHNEYLHFLFEIGLAGFLIILYCIQDIFRIRSSLLLKTVFLGFMVGCLFNWPAHLWVVTPLVFFVYASLYVLKEEKT